MSHDPLRWVCQYRAADCDGMRYSRGRLTACPLSAKCREYKGKRTPYEYMYPKKLCDPQRYMEHAKRSCELRRVFLSGEDNPDMAYYRKNKTHLSQYYKNRYRERMMKNFPEKLPGTLPPCGCDCEQCPYEDGCHYEDSEVAVKRPGVKSSLPETTLREMVRTGYTVPEMSRTTNISQKALRNRCYRLGLKPKRAIAKPKKERK